MNADPSAARQFIQNAWQAVRKGEGGAARRWAEMAAVLAPDQEEPWLILAGLAGPRESVEYLERALKINPSSERARQAMRWAARRLREAEPERAPDRQPVARVRRMPAPGPERAAPARVSKSAARPRAAARGRWLFAALLLVCAAAGWAAWPGNAAPALAVLRGGTAEPQSTATLPGAPADIAKPTYTPSLTPTPSFTPTHTSTFTPTSTPTFTPTDTPSPTPTPTDTPIPTDTPPYDTPIPYAPPAYDDPCRGGGNARWINVDLSEQRLYACEYGATAAAFVVSTGTYLYPTVTGDYHIYIKLPSTRMTGPGYDLPNVPYTMYFYKGYGIHGTYWHNNFGVPMSHGCINMRTTDAAWLYYWAAEGTLVHIHY